MVRQVAFEEMNDMVRRDDYEKLFAAFGGFCNEIFVPGMESIKDAKNHTCGVARDYLFHNSIVTRLVPLSPSLQQRTISGEVSLLSCV